MTLSNKHTEETLFFTLLAWWISNIKSELSWSFLGHWRHLLEMGKNCSKNVHDRMNKEHFWEVYIYTVLKLLCKCYSIFHFKVLFEHIWIACSFLLHLLPLRNNISVSKTCKSECSLWIPLIPGVWGHATDIHGENMASCAGPEVQAGFSNFQWM